MFILILLLFYCFDFPYYFREVVANIPQVPVSLQHYRGTELLHRVGGCGLHIVPPSTPQVEAAVGGGKQAQSTGDAASDCPARDRLVTS